MLHKSRRHAFVSWFVESYLPCHHLYPCTMGENAPSGPKSHQCLESKIISAADTKHLWLELLTPRPQQLVLRQFFRSSYKPLVNFLYAASLSRSPAGLMQRKAPLESCYPSVCNFFYLQTFRWANAYERNYLQETNFPTWSPLACLWKYQDNSSQWTGQKTLVIFLSIKVVGFINVGKYLQVAVNWKICSMKEML